MLQKPRKWQKESGPSDMGHPVVSVQIVSVSVQTAHLADVLALVPGGDPLQGQVIPLQHQPRVLPGNRATQF